MYELQYVPLALPFFLFLDGVFLFIVVLIHIHVLRYAAEAAQRLSKGHSH